MPGARLEPLVAILVLSLAGCPEAHRPIPPQAPPVDPDPVKTAECNKLVLAINTGVRSLQPGAIGRRKTGAEGLAAMADAADKVAVEVGKVEVAKPELAGIRDEYRGLVTDVARTARALGAAVETKDTVQMHLQAAEMERVNLAEDALVDRLNDFCHAR
jgi:hypothetical protein